MKILHLTPHFYIPENYIDKWEVDLDQIGGMQTQIYRQCKLLETEDVYQEVLTILPHNRKQIELSDKLIIRKSNWRMLPIKSKINCTAGLNFYWLMGTIFNLFYFKIKRINFDCIHVHCSGVSAPLIIALISHKLFNSRIVLTIHCSRIATYKPMGIVDKLFNKVAQKIEKKALKKSDKIIVLTNKTQKNIIEKTKISVDKFTLIPNMISFKQFNDFVSKDSKDSFKRKFCIPNNKKIVCFIGRVAHEKGWKYFIDTMKWVNAFYLICGDGPERVSLEKEIKENDSNNIVITGFVSNEEVANCISCADVIVIPSLHEEFGSLVLEVASLKKAVVAFDVGGLSENIINNVTGVLVKSGDSEKLASSINELLVDSIKRNKLGENLYNDMINRYDSSKFIELYKKIYYE